MTRHELASFALKPLGIYALIESLPVFLHIGSFAYMLRTGRNEPLTVL